IRRWKIENQQQQGPTIRRGATIRSVVVSQDGRWIVSGDDGNRVTVWNAATHKKVHEFTEYSSGVMAVDISSDCTKVVAVTFRNNPSTTDVTIRIHDITPSENCVGLGGL
ncbi:hypothetical protein PISMIDRAFT_124058, partial [Pisolithus microcarpus 441]